MEKYFAPEIEVVNLKNVDIITSSLSRPDSFGEESTGWGIGVGIEDLKSGFFRQNQ